MIGLFPLDRRCYRAMPTVRGSAIPSANPLPSALLTLLVNKVSVPVIRYVVFFPFMDPLGIHLLSRAMFSPMSVQHTVYSELILPTRSLCLQYSRSSCLPFNRFQGYLYSNGYCSPQCNSNQQCAPSSSCQQGTCTCNTGYSYYQGQCSPSCTTNNQCIPNSSCQQGVCACNTVSIP